MIPLTRDETEHGKYYYTSNYVDGLQAEIDELRAALKAQPEQQPRAYIAFSENGEHISYWTRSLEDAQTWTGRTNKKCEPFYPAPVQPAPLTDEQIKAIVFDTRYKGVIDTARAIEAAIKGGAT